MPQAVDEAGNIWETDAQGNALRFVGKSGGQAAAQTITTQRDPSKAIADARAQQEMMLAAQRAAREQTTFNERNNPKPSDAKPLLTAKERADAISAYKSANQMLSTLIPGAQQAFKAGPGATSGLAGLQDYLPTPSNQQFDKSTNAMRGQVGSLLGFTGGQLNTATEAAQAVGPYIPKASDYDVTTADTFQRLTDLANQARDRSIAVLGGVPDANGKVTPVPAGGLPSPAPQEQRQSPPLVNGMNGTTPMQGGGGANPLAPSSAAFRPEQDPQARALIDRLLRSGAPIDQINREIAPLGMQPLQPDQYAAARKYLAANPKGALNIDATRYVPQSMMERAANSAPAQFLQGGLRGVSAGLSNLTQAGLNSAVTGDSFGNSMSLVDAKNDAGAAAHPVASGLGEVAGGIGGMMLGGQALQASRFAPALAANPRLAALAGDVAYGGTYGATTNPDAPVTGAALGAVGGLVGNRLGAGIQRGVGGAMRGVVNPAVQALQARGVPMTGGQMLGGVANKIESGLESVPGIGSLIRARRNEGMQGFNRAAFNEAGQPIGATINDIGAPGMQQLSNATGQAYDNALQGVTVNGNDPAFMADMQAAVQRGQGLPEPMAGNADYTLRTRVGESFQPNGDLTGNDFQQSVRGLRGDARAMRPLPFGNDFGQVTGQAETALEGLLHRQSPGTLPAYRQANEAYRRGSVITDALNTGVNQVDDGVTMFTPAQLARASTTGTKKFGGRQAAATGNRPFAALTDAGQQVLPDKLPNSGTADRAAIMALIPGIGAGAGYAGAGGDGAAGGTAGGLGALGIMSLLNTRQGARALELALLQRPQAMQNVGGMLVNNARIGGAAGRAIGAPLLLQGN